MTANAPDDFHHFVPPHRSLAKTASRPPTESPVTGKPVPDYYLHSSSVHFQDVHGRSVLLRGVNLSGAAKNPLTCPSQSQNGFWEDAENGACDFTNSSLNLDDGSADVHLARLRAWGYNVLRFVFTWEGLEHKGPGKYDHEYMDYIVKCLYKCKEYGFRVYMDPHQDVWSRFTGGSGAPLWTIYACGIDPQNIVPTYSALVHADYPSREAPDPQSLPPMIWASNYYRAANQTLWTLFFAGKTFAPKCIIDGKNIQDWLQDHFTNAIAALAKHIDAAGGLYDECVIGWDSINEPGEGMVGVDDISVVPKDQAVLLGPVPSPFESMKLAMGEAVTVPNYIFGPMGPKKTGMVTLDPKGVKLWLSPEADKERGGGKWGWTRGEGWTLGTCIWALHGVWDIETSSPRNPKYFNSFPTDLSREVDFVADFWRQYWMSYASTVRTWHPEAIHFMNTVVFKPLPELPESFIRGRACSTPHFYDGLTLMTKHWNWFNADAIGILRGKYWSVVQGLRVGEASIRSCMQEQLGVLKQDTMDSLGHYPTLIGEIGCPYDMDNKRAYGFSDGGKGKGDYSAQRRAWDCSINANDGTNVLNYTLWTYVPNHSHEWSDNWNGEDLSLWSKDDMRRDPSLFPHYQMRDEPATSRTGLLDSPSVSSSQTLTALYTPKGITSGLEVTPQLLVDGARAVGAFCRPFPVATVGIPDRIDFNIQSTVFKLSVRVAPQDSVDQVTEIYVPFVHYAASLDWGAATQGLSTSSSQGSLSSIEDYDDPKKARTALCQLDIAVKTSIGSYTTAGQYLYWTYPIPARETVYTIEIRRNGGAMSIHEVQPEPTWADIFSDFLGCTVA